MQNKDITVQYSFLQATFWMGFSAVSAFASVYLLSLGISNSTIGLVIAFGALFAALIQPVTGNLVDNSRHFTLRKVLMTTAAISVIASMLLYPISSASGMVAAIMYGFLILLIQFGQPFSNAIGMAGQNKGYKLLFGPARAIGSLGYALTAYILGIVTEKIGPQVVPVSIAVIFLLHFLSVLIFPLKEDDDSEVSAHDSYQSVSESLNDSDNSQKSLNVFDFLKSYKEFSIMLVGLVIVYFGHVALNSFTIQIITSKGGDSSSMGLATAISAGVELVPMFLFPIAIKKIRVNQLLRISVVFFTLKILFTYLAQNVYAYYAVQACQMLGWGVMAVAMVIFVNENIGEHDRAQGQAFAGMALTLGNVIGGLFGGIIIDALGIANLLIISLATSVIGSVIFWFGIGKSEKIRKPS